jgi:hypothetical protein
MATVTYSFTLDTEKDGHLYQWLDGLRKGEKSKAIRDALAAHLDQNSVTHLDILEAIERLERRGVAAVAQEEPDAQDDPELAEALENLSKLGL